MATRLEIARSIPRSAQWAKERLSRFDPFRRRELPSWKEDHGSSFLEQAPNYIMDFDEYKKADLGFLVAFDKLTKIYRVDIGRIIPSARKKRLSRKIKKTTYDKGLASALNYFVYEYLIRDYPISPLDDPQEVKDEVEKDLKIVAQYPTLEGIAGRNAAQDLKRSAGVSSEASYS